MPWTELTPHVFPAFEKNLEGISAQTMTEHYTLYRDFAAAANESRKLLDEFDYDHEAAERLQTASHDYTAALLGFRIHELYFRELGGSGGGPERRFAEVIEAEFHGGVDEWWRAFRTAAYSTCSWVVVGYDISDGSVFNYLTDSEEPRTGYNLVPLLVLDLCEHAYTRDYGANLDGRSQYVEAFFNILSWDQVNRQLAVAEAARAGVAESAAADSV